MGVGRISGDLLEQNLNLSGDLSFNDNLLVLDNTNNRIGIKNLSPGVELDVTGTARATTVSVLGDLSMEWSISMDAQDNLNFSYNDNTLISFNSFGNITGTVATELEQLTDVDLVTNNPTTTSGLVLTSDGDGSYSFQVPVVTTQMANLTDVDFTTNTPTTTSGLVLTSDGDSSYSFRVPVVEPVKEAVQFIDTALAIFDLDVINRQIFYQTITSGANWTLNIRGDADTTLDSYLVVGESITVVYMATQGATAYFNNAVTIDGVTMTPRWSFGNSPTAGTPNAIDVYSYTITKTAEGGTYTVLGNVSLYQ